MEFKNVIRAYRQAERLTQKELADRLNIAPSTVGMYEQGRRIPDIEAVFDISKKLSIPVTTLLGLAAPTLSPEESALLDLYRRHKSNGPSKEIAWELRRLFSGLVDMWINPEEKKLLDTFRRLDEDGRDILIGKAKDLLRDQKRVGPTSKEEAR